MYFGSHDGILHPAFNVNPNFGILNYSYRVSSTALWQEQYWIFGSCRWKPYLFMGVGVTWNHLFDYFESASNGSTAPVITPFHSYTQAHVAYGFGMGIHYVLHNQSRVDVGYRYINLGGGSLGRSSIQTTDARLRVNNLYAHMITLSLYLK